MERLHRKTKRTVDHLANNHWWDKVNNAIAVFTTKVVGTMWCAYAFAAIALYGLPSALKPGGEGLVSWIAQTFLQLVLLSVIIVGQNIQSAASDARSEQTFNDAEELKDLMNTDTEGGLQIVLSAINSLRDDIKEK